jgi:hypothetical protein
LNYLVLIDEVGLLPALFGQVLLPQAVFQELQHLAVGQSPGMDHPRLLTECCSSGTNQVDQSNDGSISIVEIGEAVLAGDADISLRALPWIFTIVFANVPFLAGWGQQLYLAGKALYLRDFPTTYLIVVIELPIEMSRDLRKRTRDIRVAPSNLSHTIGPTCGS